MSLEVTLIGENENFSRKVLEELSAGRRPEYLTVLDLVELGYKLAVRDWLEGGHFADLVHRMVAGEFVRLLHVVDGPSDGIEGIIVWVKGQGWAGWKPAAEALGNPGRYRPLSPLQEE